MGTGCLLGAGVTGGSRDPVPPARTIPFSMAGSDGFSRNHEEPRTHEDSLYKRIRVHRGSSCLRESTSRPRSSAETEPLSIVSSRLHLLAPVAMLDVPAHGAREAILD